MNLFTRDNEGQEVVKHVADEVFDEVRRTPNPFALDDAMHSRYLAMQNILRWYVVHTNWTQTFAVNTWYTLVVNTETINGDLVTTQGGFRCQVPGRHSLVGLFEGKLSITLVNLIKTQRVELVYIVTHQDGTSSGQERLGRNSSQRAYIPASSITALYEWSIPFADELDLLEGDLVTFQWRHLSFDVIDFLEDFYFRFAIVRNGDPTTSTICCNCS
ncbi:MAG: hypothetical protein JSS89_13330 [Bacteroidetes bacterium]|nr:hypothetical protein [Bacteroidota bacterium]